MKRFLFLILLSLVSCNNSLILTNKTKQTSGDLFKTIKFGNCEYVQVEYGIGEFRTYQLIHKDNCPNH